MLFYNLSDRMAGYLVGCLVNLSERITQFMDASYVVK